jgi:hypothetical protein
MTAIRYEYFVHDARTNKRLDGPYTSRKAALRASVKFNEQGVPTVVLKHAMAGTVSA